MLSLALPFEKFCCSFSLSFIKVKKNNPHKPTILFLYCLWKTNDAVSKITLSNTEFIFFFPVQENHIDQDLRCLLICSSLCFCMRKFNTELNQAEHIQSTCNFFIIKMIASLRYFPPLGQIFPLLLPSYLFSEMQKVLSSLPTALSNHLQTTVFFIRPIYRSGDLDASSVWGGSLIDLHILASPTLGLQ